MRTFRFFVLALVLFNSVQAAVYPKLCFSEEGYWYTKAECNDPILPESVRFYELWNVLSPAEILCFLTGNLRNDHPAIERLAVWEYVKDNNLQIPQTTIDEIKQDTATLNRHLNQHTGLLKKIMKFWGIEKNVYIYAFYSKLGEKHKYISGSSCSNFIYGNDIYTCIFMHEPPLKDPRMPLSEHLGCIAHEFSHSMYTAAHYENGIFAKEWMCRKIAKLPSPNAIIASWCMDEALAVVLGHGIFADTINGEKGNLKPAEYCAPGFATKLYDLTLSYIKNSKTIDDAFLEEAVRIFDTLYPNASSNPKLCLLQVNIIHPDNMKIPNPRKVIPEFSFFCHAIPFSGLKKPDEIKLLREYESTRIIIFENAKQLDSVKTI